MNAATCHIHVDGKTEVVEAAGDLTAETGKPVALHEGLLGQRQGRQGKRIGHEVQPVSRSNRQVVCLRRGELVEAAQRGNGVIEALALRQAPGDVGVLAARHRQRCSPQPTPPRAGTALSRIRESCPPVSCSTASGCSSR